MANFKVSNVNIAGIAAAVPERVASNYDHPFISREDIEKFIASTGIEQRRIADKNTCTSDLSVKAAEKLIGELGWDRSEIDILIFVSQTPDYKLPVTAALLQHRLQLPQSCMALDIPLGCSGYIYGLSVMGTMLQASKLRKGLLIVGDTSSKVVSPQDKSTEPLFGDAATVTAMVYDETAPDMSFSLGTDGQGFEAIIIPTGGFRNPFDEKSLEMIEVEPGIERANCHLVLDGMNVFTFGITQAPQNVNDVLAYTQIPTEDIDYFVFHQANLFMNEKIRKKLKLDSSKVPYSLKQFGNTSSATIPLTIVTELKGKIQNGTRMVLCGFGVGLSWGAAIITANNLKVCDLIEY